MGNPKAKTTLRKSLSNRLIQYSVSAAALFLAATEADAQGIIYTDPLPDLDLFAPSPWGTANLYVDLDQDGVDDMRFFASNYGSCSTPWTTSYVSCNCSDGSNGWGLALGGGDVILFTGTEASLLRPGDIIGSSANWGTSGFFKARAATYEASGLIVDSCESSTGGQWLLGGDAFMGIRLSKPDGYHYGWIEIEMFDFDKYTIKSWAYHSDPAVPIKAGESCSAPQNLSTALTTILDTVHVTLKWDAVALADGYKIFGRVAGSSSFVKLSVTDTTRTFADLAPNNYEWTVLSVCGAQLSEVAPAEMFTIAAAREAAILRKRTNAQHLLKE